MPRVVRNLLRENLPSEGFRDFELRKEQLEKQPKFKRFARGFFVCQELLQTNDDTKKQNKMEQRMITVFSHIFHDDTLFDEILRHCRSGTFTEEYLARCIAAKFGVWQTFIPQVDFDRGNLRDGEFTAKDISIVVDTRYKGKQGLSLHIDPWNTEDITDLVRSVHTSFLKLVESQAKFAEKGSYIALDSWLLAPKFKRHLEQIFTPRALERITLLDLKGIDNKKVREIVKRGIEVALQYNAKALREYLETGKVPNIYSLEFSLSEIGEMIIPSK